MGSRPTRCRRPFSFCKICWIEVIFKHPEVVIRLGLKVTVNLRLLFAGRRISMIRNNLANKFGRRRLMTSFQFDSIRFFYRDSGGDGLPFVFQHGLGGDVGQPFGLFRPPPGIRLLAFDCRAHGQTQPLGDPAKIRIAQFSVDLAVFLDHLAIEQAVIGGISMGAALALRFALDYPRRVLGLVLSRPAWLDSAQPAANLAAYHLIAQLLAEYGAEEGAARFAQTDVYARILQTSPDAASSLLKQFHAPLARERAVRLEQIPAESPHSDSTAWRSINVPTLVLANGQDPIHPFTFGQQLSQIIPGAEFCPIPAKSVSKLQHEADVQRNVEQFLLKEFPVN